jgi:tryptophan synthase alpha chain
LSGTLSDTFAARKTGAAFIPFFSIGDPDLAATEALVKEAAANGADVIELGFPFSDPIADGPVIQASYYRALEKGFKVAQAFELVKKLRASGLATPIIGMVSETLVYKMGLETFFKRAKEAGYSGLIVPDLPAGYEGKAVEVAKATGIALIFLCAPTTTPERRDLIAKLSSGFIYYISVAGITGTRTALPADLESNVKDLKSRTKTPVCVGFGISQPEQAASVGKFANGVIVGSALVKQIGQLLEAKVAQGELVRQVGVSVAALAKAAHG